MDMNVIREFIIADPALQALVGNNVFLFERPAQIKCDDYIIYTFKELDGGSFIRTYQLDIRVISKNILTVLDIKDKLIKRLDVFNRPTAIYNAEEAIRSCLLANGGGIAKNDEGEYNAFLFFVIKS